jgi:hypothetical protein
MNGVIGFLVFAALIVAVILWGKAKSAASRKINQTILFRGKHESGQAITKAHLTFATDAGPDDVAQAFRDHIDLPTGVQSAVLGRLYVSLISSTEVIFTSGSKVGTSFQSVVTIRPDADGAKGTYRVATWSETEGIVSDIDQMKIVEQRVRSILERLNARLS